MDFVDLLARFTAAVEAGDGTALASLFTEDGVYHDGFYGASAGRAEIAAMLEEKFWGHAEGFRWRMFDALADESMGYARYRFSYVSTLAGAEGRRVVFEGFSQFTFAGERISIYREQFDTGVAVAQLGFDAERIKKGLMRKAEEIVARS